MNQPGFDISSQTHTNTEQLMHRFNVILLSALMSLLLLSTLSCGSDDKSREQARIIEMTLDRSMISVGESAELQIRFFYSFDRVFDDLDSVIVVIRVPSELQFRFGSSAILGTLEDSTVGPRITACEATRETFLEFSFDRKDLQSAVEPEGKANAVLKLTLDALSAFTQTRVEGAAANDDVTFQCGEDFIEDTIVTIDIN